MAKIPVIILVSVCIHLSIGFERACAQSGKISQYTNDTTKIKALIAKAHSYFYKANHEKKILDSGYYYAKLALDFSKKIHDQAFENKVNDLIANYYNSSGNQAKAIQIQQQVISFYQRSHNPSEEAVAWNELADYYSDLNRIYACCQQAQNIYIKIGRPVDAIGEQKLWGDHLYRVMKLDSAEHVLKSVLQKYQAIHYEHLQFTYDLLALVCFTRGDLKGDLAYRLELIKCMEATGDMSDASRYYYGLAYSYSMVHQYDQSNYYAQKACKAEPNGNYAGMDLIVANLTTMGKYNEALTFLKNYIKTYPPHELYEKRQVDNDLGRIYTQLKQYDKAERFLFKDLSTYKLYVVANKDETARNTILYVVQYEILANVLRLDGKYQLALYYLNKIPESFSRDLRPQYLIGLELLRFKVDSGLNKYVSAIRHLQRYNKLKDSIYSVQNLHSVKEIETKYQTEKKEHTIKLLKSEQSLEKITTDRAISQRNVTFAAIAVALIISGISYSAYRRKQFSNLLISKKNNQLQILLADKEWLLKEVHHRVKNNLHTVICLLDSQALYLQDDALKAIENSKHRIYAMSLIHQKLYQSDDIKVIDMDKYLSEFLHYLEESFGSPDNIKLNFKTQAFQLDAARAIPVGLIINEAVTNAYKYAFPNNRQGEILVLLNFNEEEVFLSVSDNGIGFQPAPDEEIKSLGMELIKGLALDLRGELNFKREMGTTLELRFKIDKYTVIAEKI